MLAVTYFLLIFIFIVGNCEENNNFHEPKNTNQNLAKSFQVLKEYHEQAQSLEKQLDKLQEFQIYAEKVKLASDQVQPTLGNLEKLCDRLEWLMTQGRKGKLTSTKYKEELLDVDQQRKRLASEIDLFEANITSVKPRTYEFDEMKEQMLKDMKAFNGGRDEFGIHVGIVQSKIELLNEKDESIKGFQQGREIDFDSQLLKQLQDEHEFLENLEDESFKTTMITELHDASREILGRFLPSIGSITARVVEKRGHIDSYESELNKNVTGAEKLHIQLHATEERYRKVVEETAILLKEMMRDEL